MRIPRAKHVAWILSSGLLIAGSAVAAPTTNATTPSAVPFAHFQFPTFPKKEEIVALKKSMEDFSGRKPANASQSSDPGLDDFLNRQDADRPGFLVAKTPQDMEKILAWLDANVDKPDTSPSVKYLGAQLRVVHQFRSVVPRIWDLFKGKNATHSLALTFVKQVASDLQLFFPENPSDPLFQYFTEEWKQDANDPGLPHFKSMKQFQAFLKNNVNPSLNAASNALIKLTTDPAVLGGPSAKGIVFDKRVVFGANTYGNSAVDQFRSIGPAELCATLASTLLALHNIDVFVAYNQKDLVDVVQNMGKMVGIDGFLGGRIEGVTALRKRELLCGNPPGDPECVKGKYRAFLTLRTLNPAHGPDHSDDAFDGSASLGEAFVSLWYASVFLGTSYNDLASPSAHGAYSIFRPILRPALVQAIEGGDGQQQILPQIVTWQKLVGLVKDDASLRDSKALATWDEFAGKTVDDIRSSGRMPASAPTHFHNVMYGGLVANVDLAKFYTADSPARDNLKEFLAIDFDRRDKINGHENYYQGRPLQWSAAAYQAIFPDVKNDTTDITDAARAIRWEWGGSLVALPLRLVLE